LPDGNAQFLIDECLSPELTEIAKDKYGVYATYVLWMGTPPRDLGSWKDPDIVDRIAETDFVFVTNNRRDFVATYYPRRLEIHNGPIIILQRVNLAQEKAMFRAATDFIARMSDTVNKLVEVDSSLTVSIADWPATGYPDPWSDPFKPR
jgi:predicted nuclease of predicted toxin-antitoxin system